MAKLLIKLDVRKRSSLFKTIEAQSVQRKQYGEASYSVWVDDDKRNICYVTLDWESLISLHVFVESHAFTELVKEWPIVEILDTVKLKDLSAMIENK